MMLTRIYYSFIKTLKHRKDITKIKDGFCIENITQLTKNFLENNGIKYLALDFDGVLAAHGKPEIYTEVKTWLDNLVKSFSEENIFILSNKPTQERLEYFRKFYPQISFISGVAKKPYPDGLLKIIELTKCKPENLALVDDRLLTGCLACIIANCRPILVTKPYIDMQNYNTSERFFNFLRKSEQKLFL